MPPLRVRAPRPPYGRLGAVLKRFVAKARWQCLHKVVCLLAQAAQVITRYYRLEGPRNSAHAPQLGLVPSPRRYTPARS